jgi:hypothetical protein
MEEADAMKMTSHAMAHVFRRSDIGNVDALRARLAKAREYVDALPKTATVTPIRAQG